ncbi:MAG: VanW family protein [Clostridia bacterium]|nr:VanW family protein [Clostridia bacterium]
MKRLAAAVLSLALMFSASCAQSTGGTAGHGGAPDPATDEQNAPEQTKPAETELISVVTPLNDKRAGRIANIRIACETLQGKVLLPGEEFSFNESVGRRTMERGFKKAVIFRDNEKENEVGGGICQVSSALYKAAKDAGLTVTERHGHQLPVDYVPKGDDATVYYGELDLKFVNSADCPIRMDFHLGEDELTVTLTGIEA